MATAVKKENLSIAIREYQDTQGQTKKVWKTIGELITWEDGRQSFEMWGPTGSTRGSVFDQDNQRQAPQQGYQQAPQQPQRAPAPQEGFGQPMSQTAPQPPQFDDIPDF